MLSKDVAPLTSAVVTTTQSLLQPQQLTACGPATASSFQLVIYSLTRAYNSQFTRQQWPAVGRAGKNNRQLVDG